MDTKWKRALSWLWVDEHRPTAKEAAELKRYFERHPHQLRAADEEGNLPLHTAARNQKGEHALAIITSLLTGYAHGARQTNEDGRLPLHYAAMWQTGHYGAAIVAALVAAYPVGAQLKDKSGDLPVDNHDSALPKPCVWMLQRAAEGRWRPTTSPPSPKGTPRRTLLPLSPFFSFSVSGVAFVALGLRISFPSSLLQPYLSLRRKKTIRSQLHLFWSLSQHFSSL